MYGTRQRSRGGARILGVGGYRPTRVVTNDEVLRAHPVERLVGTPAQRHR